ncbi:MAG: hypothetical protein AAF610_07095 [Pseudomonadota bacterium]
MTRALISLVLFAGSLSALAELPEALRNPFAPSTDVIDGPAPVQTSWSLRATLVDGQASLANIDGKLLSLGDSIDGAILTRIELDRVELTVDERTVVVRLNPVDDTTPPDTTERDRASR